MSDSLYLDTISCMVSTGEEDYVEIPSQGLHQKEIGLTLVERQYAREIPTLQAVLRSTGRSLSSVDLLERALGGVNWEPDSLQLVLLAQSYPDIEPLAGPLQQILDRVALKPPQALGLTHLEARGAIEGLLVLDWMLKPGKQALLLAAEALPFFHHRIRPGRLPLANGSTCLQLSTSNGALRITPDSTSPDSKFIIVQNGLRLAPASGQVPYQRSQFADFDYQSSDVWISLINLLQSGQMRAGDTVTLIAGDESSVVSSCVIEMVSMPTVSLSEM